MMDKTLENERVNEIVEAAMKVARGDYSVQIELSGRNDELDSLAMSLNMMIDDVRTGQEELRIKNSAIASSINAIALADLEGNLTYVNQSFLELWGYDDKEVLGKAATEFWQMGEKAAEIIEPGFPISTLSEPTSNIFVLETDDIPLLSDCQPD